MVSAIIVAGGSSQRMGFDKLEALLAGKEVLRHSIEAFENCNAVNEIYLVCPEQKREELDGWRGKYGFRKLRGVAIGGSERQDSVAQGIALLSPHSSIIAVHDGARPLITPSGVHDCLLAAKEYGAAALARPITETIKRSDSEDWVNEDVGRENLWVMETPQAFQRELLEKAYQYVKDEGLVITDEVSALQALGQKVKLVSNPQPNPKITYPGDIELAEQILSSRQK